MRGIHISENKHTKSYRYQSHHHDEYQVLFVIDGEGTIVLEGVPYLIRDNDVVFVSPKREHAVSSESQLNLLVLTVLPELLHSIIAPMQVSDIDLDHSAPFRLQPLYANECRLLLRKLLFESRKPLKFSDWAMRSYVGQLLLLLSRMRHHVHIDNANSLRAERIRAYVDEHYFESLTAELLAQKFQVSVRYAHTIFKEKYQLTPIQYVNEVRHTVAKKLLIETTKSVATICFEVGYESIATFYRSFKHFTGTSPEQFRKQQEDRLP
ncbi:helix-turn-helix domain-containing protein [Paenibacillus oryzisoli]|uniref:helix-turn-helix transcriptional regulator n=1 Tax=Paenibacillus oryzisoli TaxID=1850517 RepID=UPI003D2B981F